MSRYNPVCETCNSRPKMDRCDCCEECWYSGRYTEQQRLKSMTPAERRAFDADVAFEFGAADGWPA